MVMELCAVPLRGLLLANELNEDKSWFYLAELADGIEALHRNLIMHRDIKPENILVSRDGHVKIGDLGLAVMMKSNQQTVCGSYGTKAYFSPEMIMGKPYGFAHDWWQYGVVVFEILSFNLHPYAPPNDEIYDMTKHAILKAMKPENIRYKLLPSDNARSFVRKLLSIKPGARLNYQEIHDHVYMQRFRWDALKTFFPPPLLPTQINVDFNKLCHQIVSIKRSTHEGPHIEGFDAKYDDFSDSFNPFNHTERARRSVGQQYDLLDAEQSENDCLVERRIETWLQAYRPFNGFAAVRSGIIICRINNCKTEYQLMEDNNASNFQRHVRQNHEIKEDDDDEPLGKKSRIY